MRISKYPTDLGLWGDWVWDVNICSQENIYFYSVDMPLYKYRLGNGVGVSTPSHEIQFSYLCAAKKIYYSYQNQIGWREKYFLLGEITYLESKCNQSLISAAIGFGLFIFNALVFRDATLFKSNLIRYIPTVLLRKLMRNAKQL
jgi:hypothetical protein